MNNKKGYTLIELLAVLAIMAAILLVAVPSISKQLAGIEENNYSQFKQNLYLAAESYVNSNTSASNTLKNDKKLCVKISDLISGGWVRSTLTNPKTGENVSNNSSVYIVNDNSEYKYTYYPTSDTCNK
jgi:type IV pilus assembly protein PilA